MKQKLWIVSAVSIVAIIGCTQYVGSKQTGSANGIQTKSDYRILNTDKRSGCDATKLQALQDEYNLLVATRPEIGNTQYCAGIQGIFLELMKMQGCPGVDTFLVTITAKLNECRFDY